jgi:hypothetical protein
LGSNAGDDFHELWATRQVLRLLLHEDNLQAVTVEGLIAQDQIGAPQESWDGVDCALYYGGADAASANRIALAQCKYSGSAPHAAWTVARFIEGVTRNHSVIARLATAWKTLRSKQAGNGAHVDVLFVSNQRIDSTLAAAIGAGAAISMAIPIRKPRANASLVVKLAYASGLSSAEFQAFCQSFEFVGRTGSRFALEEGLQSEVAKWTDQDIQAIASQIRKLVRDRMRPEGAGEAITRWSILLHLGASSPLDLLPCPSKIVQLQTPVTREAVRDVMKHMQSGGKYICLHGGAGIGKTTALQEVEVNLPTGSVMITYDCYGAGRYLDPSALRHRRADAFLQLTNELATRLQLPLLLTRRPDSDYPRLFMARLRAGAAALAAECPGALIVIAIDAADNAVFAASSRIPAEPCFVHDFLGISDLPDNVRFLVTARTGRLNELVLPHRFLQVPICPFTRNETAQFARQRLGSPLEAWIDDFHHLSGGVPRVQSYAFDINFSDGGEVLSRLRPGKSLQDIFQGRFDEALAKHGHRGDITRLCAALSALPRPIPMRVLSGVLGGPSALFSDICSDLAPGIRLQADLISFADEDFEDFVREAGAAELPNIRGAGATWLLARTQDDEYAALNVATLLVAAERGNELLELVEAETTPVAIHDSLLRKEVEAQRLRLAIKVCREANDVPRALQFVLIGAEGINTEAVLRDLLAQNPDLAARFASDTSGRLILMNADDIEHHGSLLFQKLSVDAIHGDAISVREGFRLISAWLQARRLDSSRRSHRQSWKVSASDLASAVYAILLLDGSTSALRYLARWKPISWRVKVASELAFRLIVDDRIDQLQVILADDCLKVAHQFLALNPLALSGVPVDRTQLAASLSAFCRRKMGLHAYFKEIRHGDSEHDLIVDNVLRACELLIANRSEETVVDHVLDLFSVPDFRRIDQRYAFEAQKLDVLLRAFVLRELRAGRTPSCETFFVPRPIATEANSERRGRDPDADHDREIKELVGHVIGIYVAVAKALSAKISDEELKESLNHHLGAFEREKWRIESRSNYSALRDQAMRYLTTLLATTHASTLVLEYVLRLDSDWKNGLGSPDPEVFNRLCLRKELHSALLADLSVGASLVSQQRLSGDEKSRLLVGYARDVARISDSDAQVIFGQAIEAAGEVDREVVSQIRLLHGLWRCGASALAHPREQAVAMSELVGDASMRIGHDDNFPWRSAMSSLARLDVSIALGNAARWHDGNRMKMTRTLAPVLRTALEAKSLTPGQVSALSVFDDDDHGLLADILSVASSVSDPCLSNLSEEAARDALLRLGKRSDEALFQNIEALPSRGSWSNAWLDQCRFVTELPIPQDPEQTASYLDRSSEESTYLASLRWDRAMYTEPDQFRSSIEAVRKEAGSKGLYPSIEDIVDTLVPSVAIRDRLAFLGALAYLKDFFGPPDVLKSLLATIRAWAESPAVRNWCQHGLRAVIVAALPGLAAYLYFGSDNVTPALERTGLPAGERQALLLEGLESHDNWGAAAIFAIAELIGTYLNPTQAADLACWYLNRLVSRIPDQDRELSQYVSAIPISANEGVARFVFAFMGDYDTRLRWRAAHAVRRLARLGQKETLTHLSEQYDRQDDPIFRDSQLPFYWLAARLWWTIAWDRIALESAVSASVAGTALRDVALNDSFPHVLIRSFAANACEKLIQSGQLVIRDDERAVLAGVAKTPLPRQQQIQPKPSIREVDDGKRFSFNSLDTLPYWYRPIVECFANPSMSRFLTVAERWIVDEWGFGDETHRWDKEPRRHFSREWKLSSHSHGERPTLERLSTHLEWHAMWCAAGELLKTQPLKRMSKDDWDFDDLEHCIRHEMLSTPPLWCADLLVPTPLVAANWLPDKGPVATWVESVDETAHRSELFPGDRADCIVVDAYIERNTRDRRELIRVKTALATSVTAGALVRALQCMNDSWDYALPHEDGSHEFRDPAYQLVGWLARDDRDLSGLDKNDPLRGHAGLVQPQPGLKITRALGLSPEGFSPIRWKTKKSDAPMFFYEVWGGSDQSEPGYSDRFVVRGHRLLADRKQVQAYLSKLKMDLIAEVEVARDEQSGGRYISEKEKKASERFDRLYQVRHDGELHIAEGRLGTWAGNQP